MAFENERTDASSKDNEDVLIIIWLVAFVGIVIISAVAALYLSDGNVKKILSVYWLILHFFFVVY